MCLPSNYFQFDDAYRQQAQREAEGAGASPGGTREKEERIKALLDDMVEAGMARRRTWEARRQAPAAAAGLVLLLEIMVAMERGKRQAQAEMAAKAEQADLQRFRDWSGRLNAGPPEKVEDVALAA